MEIVDAPRCKCADCGGVGFWRLLRYSEDGRFISWQHKTCGRVTALKVFYREV